MDQVSQVSAVQTIDHIGDLGANLKFSAVWVQWWVDANEKAPNQNLGLYIGIYALLITLSIAGLTLCCW